MASAGCAASFSTVPSERPLLRAALTCLCGYELVALTTRRVPTVSAWMWRARPSTRALVWVAAAVVLTDHFFSRRLT